jgi:predicted ferric reductase
MLISITGRLYPDAALKLHYLSVLVTICPLWLHVSSTKIRYFVLSPMIALGSGSLFQAVRVFYRNVPMFRRSRQEKAQLLMHDNIVKIRIRLQAGWKIEGGQYIQLYTPSLRHGSLLQSRPYMICWWDEHDGLAHSITLLLKPHRGLAGLLHGNRPVALRAVIDGPFGVSLNLSSYGTIIMVASGIGIAAQVPCIKASLRDCNAFLGCTRKIHLIWELEGKSKSNWRSYIYVCIANSRR